MVKYEFYGARIWICSGFKNAVFYGIYPPPSRRFRAKGVLFRGKIVFSHTSPIPLPVGHLLSTVQNGQAVQCTRCQGNLGHTSVSLGV